MCKVEIDRLPLGIKNAKLLSSGPLIVLAQTEMLRTTISHILNKILGVFILLVSRADSFVIYMWQRLTLVTLYAQF
jgi:hypothetical protein